MYFLALGLVLLILKYLDFGVVATWSWWFVVSPFALAVLWWAWADWSGYTKRKAMEKEDIRRQDRIDQNRQALGTGTRKKRP